MADLDDDVELDEATRSYVLQAHASVERITHYELLGIAPDADKKTVKRAYFRLAAQLHPDRYFGKKLGSFKPKMELLFRKISDAHEVLLSAEKRARYDASLGRVTAPASTPQQAAEDPRAAAQRRAEEEQRAHQLAAARERARVHVDAARRATAAGDLAGAIGAYRLARALLPDDKELEQAQTAVQRAMAERASESLVRQALLEEKHGHWAQAATSWKRVALARPHDESVRARIAQALARAKAT